MNLILGSVNIGSVHKSSELASPLGFLLFHRQQDGGMCEHNPEHYTRSLAKFKKWKAHGFPLRGWRHLCNVRPPHRSLRLLNSLKSLAKPWRIETITLRNFLLWPQSVCASPCQPLLLRQLSLPAHSIFQYTVSRAPALFADCALSRTMGILVGLQLMIRDAKISLKINW